jgi:multidrug efflux system outer membrane protein
MEEAAVKTIGTNRAIARATAGAAGCALLLASCTLGPDYHKPEVSTPGQFRAQTTAADATSIADAPWWSVFNDPALQQLIGEGLANNQDLQVAVARIEQARALVGVAQSEGKPQVGYDSFVGGQESFVPLPNSVGTATYGALGATLKAAWELDVWGRIRRSTESAQANLLAQEDVRRGVLLTLVTDLATGYFRLLELDRELVIAEDSTRVYKRTLDLFTDRFNAGRDSRLPVERTQGTYDASRAKAEELRKQIAEQENALSILVGGYPKAVSRGRLLTDQMTPATPTGATTALLQRRPDILAAEQRMIQANADIGVAVANYFPKIGLAALGGGIGAVIDSKGSGFGVWQAALNAAGPLYTGGRLKAVERNRRAYWDETIASYKKTVITAFQETSNALSAQQTLAQRRLAQQSQVEALKRAVDLASTRYDSGRASYFEVLEADQELFPAQALLAQTQRDELLAVVSLYKALGGGWNLAPEQWTHPITTASSADGPGGRP